MNKIAAIQMCSTHLVDDNLVAAGNLIQKAANYGAELIVLPEMFAIVGLNENDKLIAKEEFGHGKIQDFLSVQAKQNKVWIVGGTIPIESKNKIRAACLVFNNEGEMVARYDKMHLFDVTISQEEVYKESATIEPGNEFIVVPTPLGKLGLAVCYDIRFPELFRCLFNQGAEIIAIPAAFTLKTGKAHWEVLARSRAIENFCYVIGACQGGTHTSGRNTYGHSIIIDPWGTVIAKQDGYDSGIIYATINLEKQREIRQSIPVDRHQKIFFDARNKI